RSKTLLRRISPSKRPGAGIETPNLRGDLLRARSTLIVLAELKRPPGPLERAMSEVEFDQVMDAVRTAVMLAPVEDSLARSLVSGEPPKATNDNIGRPWPIIPFPEGAFVV
ncbi:MAG: hypothetical protein ABJA75_23970, partial [Bradyrhizobium sp.]